MGFTREDIQLPWITERANLQIIRLDIILLCTVGFVLT